MDKWQPPVLFQENIMYKWEDKGRYLFLSHNEISGNKRMQKPHFHGFYEVYYLHTGSVSYLIEGQLFTLKAGEIALIKPYTLHKTLYPSESKNIRYLIGFSPDYFEYMGEEDRDWLLSIFESQQPVIQLKGEAVTTWRQLLMDTQYYANSQLRGSSFRIHNFIEQLMLLLKDSEGEEQIRDKAVESVDQKIISIMAYIHEHFAENLSLEGLASKFYMSSHYLCHKFKEVSGFTVIEYIHQTRVKRAQEMLLTSKDSILQISENCGFGSISQFNRVFKKICGVSARSYRLVQNKS